ncbi:MAG: pseudouridine synthase [Deltaproteobacteria bacterium]
MAEERLQKIISKAGITSRRKAEELIIQGRVRVNRKVVTELGAKADPDSDRVDVDGELISFKGPKVYVLLNKPKSFVSTLSDNVGRPTVVSLVNVKERVFPVGRLDYDAEGVMLLTNDGEFCDKLIHPKYHVPKKYLVKVRNIPDEATLQKLRDGVYLDDGRTRPATVKFVRKTEGNAWIEIIVTEGKNRLIKRMCQRVGHPVNKLKRIEFAGIGLGKLALGEWRFLTAKEVEGLISMPMPSALPRTRPRPDAQTKPARSARPERSGKHGRFARPERSGKPEERSGKPARFTRPERPAKPERFSRPERSEKPARRKTGK